jgi:CheY-like chemotaxis protein
VAHSPNPDTLRILVAEDDPDDRLLLTDALQESGLDAELLFLDDGEQVLGHLERIDPAPARHPDLVVLDLNLPRRDGRRTLREIKADPRLRSLPVVILTTSDSAHDIDECLRAGARAYLVKPASFSRLVDAVRMFPAYAEAA